MLITDSWADIEKHIADGSYKTRYAVGDEKTLDIRLNETRTTIKVKIAAFDADDLYDRFGKAAITWVTNNVLLSHAMHPTNTNVGGWAIGGVRTFCLELYNCIIDEDARALIKPVRKEWYNHEIKQVLYTKDYCWIPSYCEVFGRTHNQALKHENHTHYTECFKNSDARTLKDLSGTPSRWWLRSASTNSSCDFCSVDASGCCRDLAANRNAGIVLGFCTAV